MKEAYWHQRARVNWGLFGDQNTKFFHTTAVTRKRKNTIKTIMLNNGSWATSEREIRDEFLVHFRLIYSKRNRAAVEELYPPDLLADLPRIPELVHN